MRSLGSRESKTGESKQDSGSSFSKKSRGSASSKGGGDWNVKLSGNLQDMKMMETLGTGTFGRVRLILHKPSTNYYALKILKKSEVVRLKQVEHVLSERQILINISHPFIVNLVSAFQDNTKLYMLLEYVPGGEMFSHLRRRATFESDVARLYTAEIVLAFAHLHSMKIAYRDLKVSLVPLH
jgi:serine/threonine protein kinase